MSHGGNLTVPIFTVIIPTRNRPSLLLRAIRSVVTQTFRNFEVIVVDDASESPVFLGPEFSGEDIQLVRTATNGGAAAARNTGVLAARGSYISFLDDDDEYDPAFLQTTYNAISRVKTELAFSWCGVRFANHSVLRKAPEYTFQLFSPEYHSKTALFAAVLSIGTGFGLTVRTDHIRAMGPFDASLRVTEDTDFLLRLLIAGFLPIAIPDALVTVHNHRSQRLTDQRFHEIRIKECQRLTVVYAEFLDRYPPLRILIENHIDILNLELKNNDCGLKLDRGSGFSALTGFLRD
jgi:glycosyltransferase involved in cell wall biosynthesis